MDQNEINDRVARGAALLDEKRPGWLGEISLDRLAMLSGTECALGQLYGSYRLAVDALWPDEASAVYHCCAPSALAYGFQSARLISADHNHHGEYGVLQSTWEARITALRNEQVQVLLSHGWLLSRDSLTMISPATGREISITNMSEQYEQLLAAAA